MSSKRPIPLPASAGILSRRTSAPALTRVPARDKSNRKVGKPPAKQLHRLARLLIGTAPNVYGTEILPDGAEAHGAEVPAVKTLVVPTGGDPNLAVLNHIRAERIVV